MKNASTSALNFTPGHSGFPRIEMYHAASASRAEIYSHGATLTSLSLGKYTDILFLSSRAVFAEGKAIRGGMPLVFPQFGGGPLPQHGFARNLPWKGVSSQVEPNGDLAVHFELTSGTATRSKWPHDFRCVVGFFLAEKLKISYEVENTGNTPLSYQLLLHPYFRVSSIHQVRVRGLMKAPYLDKVLGGVKGVVQEEELSLASETDRVHQCNVDKVEIIDPALQRKIILTRAGFPDVVTWNPWKEKADAMTDMGKGEWEHFICVEPGAVSETIQLAPGETRQASATIEVEEL